MLNVSEHNCKECKFGELVYSDKCNCGCGITEVVWRCNSSKGRGVRRTELYQNGEIIKVDMYDINNGQDDESYNRLKGKQRIEFQENIEENSLYYDWADLF